VSRAPQGLRGVLRRLDAHGAPAVAGAVIALWIAEVALRGPGLRTACRWLGIRDPGEPPLAGVAPIPETMARAGERRASRALRLSGLPNTCLRRALAGGYLTRSFRPTLRLGVRKRTPFEAHAWLEYAGIGRDAAGLSAACGGLRRPE
jgi:Transglutaminase-like superfamily